MKLWCDLCERETEHEPVTDPAWARALNIPQRQCAEHGKETA